MLSLERQNAYRERYRTLRPGWQPSGEVYEATVRRYLPPDERVLDLGCGRGGLPEKLSLERALLFGLDPDQASLAAYRASGVALAAGQAEALPYEANAFDLVMAAWLLEHLTHPGAALAEIRRVLAPGGTFVFITPNALHPLLLVNRGSQLLPMLQRRLIPRLYGRAETDTFSVHYRANSPAALHRLAAAHGFEVVHLQLIPDPTYLAFNDLLFRMGVLLERLTPASLRIHIVGMLRKSDS